MKLFAPSNNRCSPALPLVPPEILESPNNVHQLSTLMMVYVRLSTPLAYKISEMLATRFTYETALAKLANNNPRIIALDGDSKNSTYSERIKKVSAERYIESFVANQKLIGVAIRATSLS